MCFALRVQGLDPPGSRSRALPTCRSAITDAWTNRDPGHEGTFCGSYRYGILGEQRTHDTAPARSRRSAIPEVGTLAVSYPPGVSNRPRRRAGAPASQAAEAALTSLQNRWPSLRVGRRVYFYPHRSLHKNQNATACVLVPRRARSRTPWAWARSRLPRAPPTDFKLPRACPRAVQYGPTIECARPRRGPGTPPEGRARRASRFCEL
jgi:hypothetical protein